MFTTQHYEAIAKLFHNIDLNWISSLDDGGDKVSLSSVELAFADLFAEDNKLFSREKFLEACSLVDMELGECDRCFTRYDLSVKIDENDDNPDGLCLYCRQKDGETVSEA